MAKIYDTTKIKDPGVRSVMELYLKLYPTKQIATKLAITDYMVEIRITKGRKALGISGPIKAKGPKKKPKLADPLARDFDIHSKKVWELSYLPFGQWGNIA